MRTSISIILGTVLIAGCATSGTDMSAGSADTSTTIDQAEVQAKQRRIEELEERLANREAELQRAQASASQSAPTTSAGSNELFPPNPKTGECYARVLIPAQYKTGNETVLVREASESVEIIPARYETVEERVLVKEAETKLEIVPAVYGTVEERVLVKPASTRLEEIPASYKKTTETVLVSPARTEWKRGPASSFGSSKVVDTASTDTGEIMCLVEVPAVYETVTRTVLDQPARTREVTIPAEYKTVKKRVITKPASTREVVIPAEYGTVKVTKLVQPAREKRSAIPAEYKTVTKREKTRDEKLAWRQVVCEVNLNASNVRSLQQALKQANRYDGPVDGILGPMTLSAANGYAKAKGLPAGTNYIAMEVVDDLGLKF